MKSQKSVIQRCRLVYSKFPLFISVQCQIIKYWRKLLFFSTSYLNIYQVRQLSNYLFQYYCNTYLFIILIPEMKNQRRNKKEPKITQKKLQGDKVYYLLVKNRTKKWIDFDSIDDYLQLVMEYEKQQEDIKSYIQEQDNCDNTREQEKQQHHCSTRSKMKKNKSGQKKDQERETRITNILFLNKNEGQLFFKLIYQNGLEEVIGNKELRYKHPQQLITFYENNVQIMERQVDEKLSI